MAQNSRFFFEIFKNYTIFMLTFSMFFMLLDILYIEQKDFW